MNQTEDTPANFKAYLAAIQTEDTPANFKANLVAISHLLRQVISSSHYSRLLQNPDYNPDTTLTDAEDTIRQTLFTFRI